jgi:hypothetical protein
MAEAAAVAAAADASSGQRGSSGATPVAATSAMATVPAASASAANSVPKGTRRSRNSEDLINHRENRPGHTVTPWDPPRCFHWPIFLPFARLQLLTCSDFALVADACPQPAALKFLRNRYQSDLIYVRQIPSSVGRRLLTAFLVVRGYESCGSEPVQGAAIELFHSKTAGLQRQA